MRDTLFTLDSDYFDVVKARQRHKARHGG